MTDLQDATTAIKLFADLSWTPTHKDGVLLIAKMLRQERQETRRRTLEEAYEATYQVFTSEPLGSERRAGAGRAMDVVSALKASSGEEKP